MDHSQLEFSVVLFLGWTRRHGTKATKFTDAQEAFVIKQDEEGTPVAEICRKASGLIGSYESDWGFLVAL